MPAGHHPRSRRDGDLGGRRRHHGWLLRERLRPAFTGSVRRQRHRLPHQPRAPPCRPPLRRHTDGLRLPPLRQRPRVRPRPLLRRVPGAARLPRVPLHIHRSDALLQGQQARRDLERWLLPRLRGHHQRLVLGGGRVLRIVLRLRGQRRQLLPRLLRRAEARRPGAVPGAARRKQRLGPDAGHGERRGAGEQHGARSGAVPGERHGGGLRAVPGEIGGGGGTVPPVSVQARRCSVGRRGPRVPLRLLPPARDISSHGKRSKASEEDERSSRRCGGGRRRNRRLYRRSSVSRSEASSYQESSSCLALARHLDS